MEAKQALADLTEISSQIRSAVIFGGDGSVIASTLEEGRAHDMAKAAAELLAAAERTRPGLGPGALTQLEVATLDGSVFVISDHGRVIAATTSSEPTVGLVFYDLKSCLRNAAEAELASRLKQKPKRPAAGRSRAEEPQEPQPKPEPKKPGRKPKRRAEGDDDAQA